MEGVKKMTACVEPLLRSQFMVAGPATEFETNQQFSKLFGMATVH